jgi:hypothetical protein
MARGKQVFGPAPRFHTAAAQATEVRIAVNVLKRMLDPGIPNSVRSA